MPLSDRHLIIRCFRIKKRNEDKLHQKILQNQTREQQIRSLQAKAAADRDERQKKLSQTKKSMDDARRAIAEKKKQESKRIEDMINNGKAQSELEKRLRAENVRKR